MINFHKVSNKSIMAIFYFIMKLIPRNTIFYILQGKLKGRKWIVGSGIDSYWLGSYEYEKQILFSKVIQKGAIVYDIGAHVGFYTLLASVLVGPAGRVFAFEPSPRNIYYLKKHLILNDCDNVTVIEAAVAEEDGIVFLEESGMGYHDHLSIKGNLKIKTISLDSLVSKGEIPPAEYMKIDAEEAELQVLLGAKNILVNYSPIIFLSTHGPNLSNQCCTFLKSMDYDLRSIDKNKDIDNISEFIAFNRSKRCVGLLEF